MFTHLFAAFPNSIDLQPSTPEIPQAPFAVFHSDLGFRAQWPIASTRLESLWHLASVNSPDVFTCILLVFVSFASPCQPLSLPPFSALALALALSAPAAQSCPPIASTPLRHSVSSSPVWLETRTPAAADRPRSSPQTSCQIAGYTCAQELVSDSDRGRLDMRCTARETYTLNCTVNPR